MRRAGLAESDIMELCGWETREMFKRYCIKDEKALGDAVGRGFNNNGQTNGKAMTKPAPVAPEANTVS